MKNKKSIVSLLFVYGLSHAMLIIITGQWWDDWCLWTNDVTGILEMFTEAGFPWQIIDTLFAMAFPRWGYRIVVFFLFLLTGLLFYMVLRRLDYLSEEDAFWMAAIAMTVPVNDARATLICYSYSLDLSLFMLAFYIATRLKDISGWKKYVMRVFCLCCMLYSYATESLLIFTGLIWLYLFCVVLKENKREKLKSKIGVFFCKYWDFFITPFVFYIVKSTFFKPYGRYEHYNNVTWKALIKGILLSPVSSLKTVALIGRSYLCQISVLSLIVYVAAVVIYFLVRRDRSAKKKEEDFPNRKKQIIVFSFGTIVFFAGIFAYVVVRGGGAIESTGVSGRDAMLAGFGIGIMVVAFLRVLPVKKTLQNLIAIFLVLLGIFHFNDWYLNYQEDWYYQQEFAKAILDNGGFADDNTILCDFTMASPNGGTRFYSLNGMSYIATGKMDKFFFSGIEDLNYGLEFNKDFLNGYNADDYDYSDRTIDGVLLVNNAPISNSGLLKIRLHEAFALDAYKEDVCSITDYSYIRIPKEISDRIYELYCNNELTSDVLRELVAFHELKK